MDRFIQKLNRLLERHFPGSETEIEPISEERVGGFLIWDGFDGLEHIQRQRDVWKIIRSELPKKEQARIASVLTRTLEEMAIAREG